MRSTYVPTNPAEAAKDAPRRPALPGYSDLATRPPLVDVLLVGFDFGTNASSLKAAYAGSAELVTDAIVPTAVGYAKDGIVENFLPGNAKVLYGELANKNRIYLRMVAPMVDGVVQDMAAAQDFARYLRSEILPPTEVELRAVVGLPATADRAAREGLAHALGELFDKIIIIPEPFLAALGWRDETRLGEPNYVDPVRNSLFVDIGAGTTDACLVQGYFPTGEDQVSVPFAGDRVDQLLQEAIRREYPDVVLSLPKVRELKEQYSFVGRSEAPVTVNLVVGGKLRRLELAAVIGQSCEQVLLKAFECVKTVIAKASTDTVGDLLQNIVLTGGGSCIRNIDTELQRLLSDEGYEKPRVQTVGESHKHLVSRGALCAARQAREDQWISLAR